MRLRGRSHGTPHAQHKSPLLGAMARLNYLRIAVVSAYACGMLLSHHLWFDAERTFPRAPLLSGLPAFLSSSDYLLSILLVASLILAAVSKRPHRYMVAAAALTVLLVILDMTRLQPWVYQYLVMLMILACGRTGALDGEAARTMLVASQLIISMLYFWSGAQKLNWSFGHEVVPRLFEQAGVHLPAALVAYLPTIGIFVAVCEALIGVALLVRRTRQGAVLLALGMHVLVLLMLVAANSNSVVWAWNAGMMVMVMLLFWRSGNTLDWRALWQWRGVNHLSHVTKAVIVLCGLMPALSFAGWWDLYLSVALYSGNAPVAVVRISDKVRDHLPVEAQRQVLTTKRGELMLPFYEWSMAELNVPPYPETRVYRQLARQLCVYAEERQEIELIVRERPALIDGSYVVRRADCSTLLAR